MSTRPQLEKFHVAYFLDDFHTVCWKYPFLLPLLVGVVEVIHFESGTLQVKFEDGPSECKPAGTLHRQTVQPVSPTVAKNQAMNVANGVVRLGTAVQNGNGTTGILAWLITV